MRRLSCCLALAALVSSCSSEHSSNLVEPAALVAAGTSTPANSAISVMNCWNDASAARLGPVLTDDFIFEFSDSDSAGNHYRVQPWTRPDELASAEHLLVGGGPHPRARHILLQFTRPLSVQPDPRPGKNPVWHQFIRTGVHLTLFENWFGTPTERVVDGSASFYLVRGDSALIPNDLAQLGWRPDSTRWWVQRWDDDTNPAGGDEGPGAAVRHTSWGQLKVDYR